MQQDTQFIDELVRRGTGDDEPQAPAEEPVASVTPETGVREDVLDELMAEGAGGDDEGNEDKAP